MNTTSDTHDFLTSAASRALAAIWAIAKGVLRAILVMIIVAIAIAIGIAIPIYFRGFIAELPPAGLAFGAATLLAVMRGLVESLPTAWDFVTSAVSNTLPKIFAQVAVAALGLGFAYYAATSSGNPGRELNLSVSGPLPPIVMNESDALLTSYVVFDDWKSAIPEGDAQLLLIDNLVDSLATCVQSSNDKVEVSIRAFASSHGPDKINESLFKERGKFVAQRMHSRIEQQWPAIQEQFQIEVRDWKSLSLMKLRRLFNDTDDNGTYLPKAGALNRRAEIRVRSAGSCLTN